MSHTPTTLPERGEGIRFSHSRKTLVRYVTKRSNYLSRRWKLVCLRRAARCLIYGDHPRFSPVGNAGAG